MAGKRGEFNLDDLGLSGPGEFDLERDAPVGGRGEFNPDDAVPSVRPGGSFDQKLITSEKEIKERAWIPSAGEAFEEFFAGVGISLKRLGLAIHDPPDMTDIPGIGEVPTVALPAIMQLQPEALATSREASAEDRENLMRFKGDLRANIEQSIQEPAESIGGDILRTLGRYSVWLPISIAATRGLGFGPWTSSIIGGTAADLAAFDPDEARLSNLLTQFDNPIVNNAVTQYLEADPADSTAEARFKQVLEGAAAGGVTETGARILGRIMMGAGALRRRVTSRAVGVRDSADMPAKSFPEIEDFDKGSLELMDQHMSQQVGNVRVRVKESKVKGTSPERMTEDFLVNNYISDLRRAFPDAPEEAISNREFLFREKISGSLNPPTTSRVRGEALDDAYQANQKALEDAHRRTWAQRARAIPGEFINKFVDRSGTFKRELLNSDPYFGKRAVMALELTQGASTKSQFYFREARKKVFGGLMPPSKNTLNQIITLRRIDEILKYLPDWTPPLDLSKQLGKGGKRIVREDIQANLKIIRERLGEAGYRDLFERSSTYFSEARKSLDVMLETGVISKPEHEALSQFRFTPIQFLDDMDPGIVKHGKGKNAITISSSGIKRLANVPETERILITDNEMFLGQIIARSNSRAARNHANQALLNLARNVPDNSVVKLKRPNKTDWVQVSVMEEGVKRKMFIHKDMINQWNVDPVGMSTAWQALFGSTFVRPFATGVNPEFAFVNFPRDIMFAWMSAGEGRLFSTGVVKGGAQIVEDLAQTAGDAWKRSGAFRDYIKEGGGMNLMTHQGRLGQQLVGQETSRLARGVSELQHFLGYINESSEIWVRLAIRNRALKQGLDSGLNPEQAAEAATWEARRYLDFSQGGGVMKMIDGAIPYSNAGIQGLRGMGRAAMNNPKTFAAKASQLAAIYAGFNFANRTVNPEAWEQVPDYIRNRYLVMTTPFYRTDDEGNKRYMYIRFPIDHTTMFLKTAVDASIEKTITGEAPDNLTMDLFSTLSGPVPGVGNLPPTMNAIMAITANHDFWRSDEIWKGRKDIPDRLKNYTRGENPTSPLARDIGEGLSPLVEGTPVEGLASGAKLEVAMRALAPKNVYTDTVGMAYKEWLADESPPEVYQGLQEALKEMPFLRRFIGETHPLVSRLDRLEEIGEEAGGEQFVRTEALAMQYQNFLREGGEFGPRQVELMGKWIEGQDPLYQDGLTQHLTNIVKAHEVFKRFNPSDVPGTPPRDWWIILSAAPPEAKALGLIEELVHARALMSSEDAQMVRMGRQKKRMVQNLMASVPGFSMGKRSNLPLALHKAAREQDLDLRDLLE